MGYYKTTVQENLQRTYVLFKVPKFSLAKGLNTVVWKRVLLYCESQ